MGISVRKEEIRNYEIHRSYRCFFVRLPFLLEGMILGVIGAAIPLICLFFLYNSAVEFILTKFNVLTGIVDFIPIWQIYEGLVPMGLGLGVGIGLLGEAFSQQENISEYNQIAENLMYPHDV